MIHVAAAIGLFDRNAEREYAVPRHTGRTARSSDTGTAALLGQRLLGSEELVLGGAQPLIRGETVQPVVGIAAWHLFSLTDQRTDRTSDMLWEPMKVDPDLTLFAHVVNRPEGDLDLAQAALLIAEQEYPSLDIAVYLDR